MSFRDKTVNDVPDEQITCDRCHKIVSEWDTICTDDGDEWIMCLDCLEKIKELRR